MDADTKAYCDRTASAIGQAVYGYCPKCGAKGVMRERRIDGDDTCENGHTYPSKDAARMGYVSGSGQTLVDETQKDRVEDIAPEKMDLHTLRDRRDNMKREWVHCQIMADTAKERMDAAVSAYETAVKKAFDIA